MTTKTRRRPKSAPATIPSPAPGKLTIKALLWSLTALALLTAAASPSPIAKIIFKPLPSPTATPIPFWKAKPEIYKKMKEDRYIAVSAKSDESGDDKKLSVTCAGIIHAAEPFTHNQVMKFTDYPKYVPYIQETTFDSTTRNLFIHGAVLGYHVRMTLHTHVVDIPNGHRLLWESIGGNFLGMHGSINEVAIDSDHTEISMDGDYTGKTLNMPAIILHWGLEFAAHRAAGSMRSHIESEWAEARK